MAQRKKIRRLTAEPADIWIHVMESRYARYESYESRGNLVADRRLCRGQTGNGHTERRATHIGEANLMEEGD